jgi:hypothetical protein
MSRIALYRSGRESRDLCEIENEITELAAHIHAATYRLLELIREFDEREGWGGPGLRSCAHWLNWKIGLSIGAAREKVRVAHALKGLPRTSDAFRRGTISFSKVRAMTRVATPENERYLLMIARHGTASHMERLVRQYRKVKRSEALEHDNQRHALRELDWYIDDDGSYVIRARLTPEQGERVVRALEAACDENDSELRNVSAETPEPPADQPASDPVAARRADALERMADAFFAGTSAADSIVTGGDRCTINLHTTADTLRADGETAESELDSGARVSAETSRRLACDCGVVHWREDEDGSVGRRTRSIPPAIRRALQRRDRGCRFPGCTAHCFVDAHHITHWADGGETKMDNLVLLCRHHHRLVHEGGYAVRMTAHGPEFADPTGRTIPPAPETRFRGNVVALKRQNRRNGLDIGPRTTIPLWEGERMDDGMAVEGLLQLE